MLFCRQLLRSKQADSRLAAHNPSSAAGSVAAGSGSRRGKHRRSGSKTAHSQAPEGGPPDEAAAAAAGQGRQAKSEKPIAAPPPIRKQRSRGRGDCSTEGDTGSAASSVGGLPPDTPAQVSCPTKHLANALMSAQLKHGMFGLRCVTGPSSQAGLHVKCTCTCTCCVTLHPSTLSA